VPAEVAVSARGADEASRWVSLQPSLPLAPVPDAVFRAEHPAPPLAVKDRKVADGDSECPGLERSNATLLYEVPVAQLSLCKRIDSHRESIAPAGQ
jgi:hypothetical protein